MKNLKSFILLSTIALIALTACKKKTTDGLHEAFSEFDSDNCDIYIQDGDVVIETTGLQNHTSPYWST